MPRYAITERAGPFVAGFRNAGVGTVLDLSERQAAHELRLGTLTALPVDTSQAADALQPEVHTTADVETLPAEDDNAEAVTQTRKTKRSST